MAEAVDDERGALVAGLMRLLVDTACRARFRKPVDRVTEDERIGLMGELKDFFRGAEEAVHGHVNQAMVVGEQRVFRAMHEGNASGDHEMLDEALGYAYRKQDD